MDKKLLQIFAKAPVAGKVKTRLIPNLGQEAACEVYLELLNETLALAVESGFQVELWCAPNKEHVFFQQCVKQYGVTLHNQCAGDLGERMAYALQVGLESNTAVVLIGADCPVLTVEYLNEAFEALGATDIVFGPAEDGGFVLVGSRAVPAGMFKGIRWSCASVLKDTLKQVSQLGLTSTCLKTLWDVDVIDDLNRWRKS